jgi:hypothetical protein
MGAMEITTKIGCRNACVYCPQALLIGAYAKQSKETLMGLGVFQECIQKIPADAEIHFSGMCEPWLNPECTSMVEYAREAGHGIHVNTTAVGMKPADVERLAAIPFESFLVHVPSGEGFERIKIDDAHLSLLRRLSDSGLVRCWLCHGHTVSAPVQPIVGGRVHHEPLVARAGNVDVGDGKKPARKKGRLRCVRGTRQNVLLPNGDVLLCCADYGMKHVLGNLREQDYDSLFLGEQYRLVQTGLKDPSLDILCRYCEHARYVSLWRTVWTKLSPEIRKARTPRDVLLLAPRLVRGVRKRLRVRKRG